MRELPANGLVLAHFGLGLYVRSEFGLNQGNDDLLTSVGQKEGFPCYLKDPDQASSSIVRELWRRLRHEGG